MDGRRETRNRNPRGWEPGNLEFPAFIPQQRKLMGSSAQNSSGAHWCRRPVRFNEVPEKVPKVPEKVWEASVQSQVRFNRVSEKVPEEVGEALVQSQVRFNRVPEKGSGEGSGEGQGGFGAARSSSTGFRRRLQRLASQHASERFVKIKFCGWLGITPKLIFLFWNICLIVLYRIHDFHETFLDTVRSCDDLRGIRLLLFVWRGNIPICLAGLHISVHLRNVDRNCRTRAGSNLS